MSENIDRIFDLPGAQAKEFIRDNDAMSDLVGKTREKLVEENKREKKLQETDIEKGRGNTDNILENNQNDNIDGYEGLGESIMEWTPDKELDRFIKFPSLTTLSFENPFIPANIDDKKLQEIVNKLIRENCVDRLMGLSLSNNQITDLSPLEKLTNLINLNVSYNKISDISPLEKLVNLRSLEIAGNNIIDISPLKKLEYLEYIDISGNDISSDDKKKLKSKIKTVIDIENPFDYSTYNNY